MKTKDEKREANTVACRKWRQANKEKANRVCKVYRAKVKVRALQQVLPPQPDA